MDIGNEIKKRRTELGMTQDELAGKLGVGRTTISNYEQGRSYPDLKMIVTISDVLDVSLDQLLRGDEMLVKKISEDTTVRKKQGKSIRKMTVIICALAAVVVILGIILYQGTYNGYVSDPREITDMYVDNHENLHIELNLPRLRSIGGYMLEDCGDGKVGIQIGVIGDLSGSNFHEYDIPIYTASSGDEDYFSAQYIKEHNITRICVLNERGEEIYGIDLQE